MKTTSSSIGKAVCRTENITFSKRLPTSVRAEKTETWLSQASSAITSLPGCLILLALLLHNGASLDTCWFINYPLMIVIALVIVTYLVSIFSVDAAHAFAENICLAFLNLVSCVTTDSVKKLPIEVKSKFNKSSNGWVLPLCIQQLVVFILALQPTSLSGFVTCSLLFAVYRFSLQLAQLVDQASLKALSTQHYVVNPDELRNVIINHFVIPTAGLFMVLQAGDVPFAQSALVVAYFAMTDSRVSTYIHLLCEGMFVESMEGKERHYCNGLMQIMQVIINLLVVSIWYESTNLVLIAAVLVNIYSPMEKLFDDILPELQQETQYLSRFPKATSSEIDAYDNVCAICLGGMSVARTTPCKHMFHGKCLRDCLQKKSQCPMCNHAIIC